jgi:small subunit ribosomal protein S16
VAVKIRLKRMGKIRAPYYRIVVADSRTKRDGKTIDQVGKYNPKTDPSYIEVNSERVQYWLSVGAQPTEPVLAILKKTGDWQKFKGEPLPSEPLRVPEPKPDKRALFDQALREAHAEPAGEAVSSKKKNRKSKGEETEASASQDSEASESAAQSDADEGESEG